MIDFKQGATFNDDMIVNLNDFFLYTTILFRLYKNIHANNVSHERKQLYSFIILE